MSSQFSTPIQMISELFDLTLEGINFLQSLGDKRLSIISLVGATYSGKSFLASLFGGNLAKGFNIGSIENREKGLTKGVWVLEKIEREGECILILDVQGFNINKSMEKDFSEKMYALINFISSGIIFSFKKDDDSSDNKQISDEIINKSVDLFVNLQNYIKKTKLYDNENENNDKDNVISSKNMPNMFYLFRDYYINEQDMKEKYKNKIYGNLKEKYNQMNKDSQFPKFEDIYSENKINFYTLPCPMDENEMLINVYIDEEESDEKKDLLEPFTDEYKKAFLMFKEKVTINSPLKSINGIPLNGALLYGVLQEYTSQLQGGDPSIIFSPMDSVVFSTLSDTSSGIKEEMISKFDEYNAKNGAIVEMMSNSYDAIVGDELKKYNNTFLGKNINFNIIIDEISNLIKNYSEEIINDKITEKLSSFSKEFKDFTDKETAEKLPDIERADDIKKNLVNLSKNIKENFSDKFLKKIVGYVKQFEPLEEYINKCIIDKINSFSDLIDSYINNNLQSIEDSSKNNEALLDNEIQRISDELIQVKTENEMLKKQLDLKEEEINNIKQIEQGKYDILESNNQNIIKENNKAMEELQNKYDNLNNDYTNAIKDLNNKEEQLKVYELEISELKQKIKEYEESVKILNKDNNVEKKESNEENEKGQNLADLIENAKDDDLKEDENKENNKSLSTLLSLSPSDIPDFRSTFLSISSSLNDFRSYAEILSANRDFILRDKIAESLRGNLDSAAHSWLERLREFREEHLQTMTGHLKEEVGVLKGENDRLTKENGRLEHELRDIEKEMEKLKEEMGREKEIKKEMEEICGKKDLTITTMEDTQKMLNKRISEKEDYIIKIEMDLSQKKCEATEKQDVLEDAIEIFTSMIEKNKGNYDFYMNKLIDNELRKQISELNKKHKCIKG